uniref:Saposin B-type domain-containing protein n=1 Tax=Timema douglasi TaxID=61478 RepID=A0A7R8VCJ6_TIMDO|nr:unnamed protein product [Timema douglasi]
MLEDTEVCSRYRSQDNTLSKLVKRYSMPAEITTDYRELGPRTIRSLCINSLIFIFENSKLTPWKVCGQLFQSNDCFGYKPDEWSVDIPPRKSLAGEQKPVHQTRSKPLTVLQVTDIHHDPKYAPGTNTHCGEPLCCRKDSPASQTENNGAGYWSDYQCDLPFHFVDKMLREIIHKHPNIDYVYMTGDIVDHAIWQTSPESNSKVIIQVTKLFQKVFPNTPVYFALGNHEPSPINLFTSVNFLSFFSPQRRFPPQEVWSNNLTVEWLYKLSADLWSHWLPQNSLSTLESGGYYTTLVRKNFRIVVLNSNICYFFNFWLLYNSRDPGGQLAWLVKVLSKAEKKKEKVHILGHIYPGGEDCQHVWSREFRRIMDRRVLRHTLSIVEVDIVTVFIACKCHDGQRQNVVDTESWVYNLTEANQNSNHAPKWFKLYSFKKDYHVSSLKPQDLDKMVHKMDKEDYLLQKHHRFYHKNSDSVVNTKCDNKCKKKLLCSIVTSQSKDLLHCDGIKRKRASKGHLVQGYHTDRLGQLVNEYSLPRYLQGVEPELLPEPYDDITCILCGAAVVEVLDIYNQNKSADALRSVAVQLCVTFNLASEDVCIGIINVHLAEAVYLANHADDASKKQLCGLYLSSCGFVDEWTIDVDLGTKPDIVTPTVPDSPSDTMTIVHVTDMHYDPTYLVGGRGDCGEPTCCREEQGTPTDGTIAAGYWGDYRHCDTPAQAVNDTLVHIKQQHQRIDYVYMTGDFVDHGVWETSQENNTKTITAVVNAVKETFGDVPVIFTLGNHEPTPVNQYAPLDVDDDVSSKWLYELVAELWSPYVTDEAKQTILQGGFYTLLLRPGFRVIILNNVVGYKSNLLV